MSVQRNVFRDPLRSGVRSADPVPAPLLFMPLRTDLSINIGTGSATYTRSSTGTFIDQSDGLSKTAAIDAARFERQGVLIEGASTNLLLRSEEFDNAAYAKTDGATITANQAVAPDGTTTADEIDITSLSTSRVSQTTVSLSAGTYTFSIFLKAKPGQSGTFPIRVFSGSGGFVSAAVFIDDSAYTRASITTTTTSSGVISVFAGDARLGTQTLEVALIWGGSLEQLPFASSYIKTVASTVTRTADNLSIDAANIPAPTLDYSVSATVDLLGDLNASQYLWKVQGEAIRQLLVNQASGLPRYRHGSTVLDGSALPFDQTAQKFTTTLSATTPTMKIYQDGVETATVTGSSVTGTNTGIAIGNDGAANELFGHIRNFRIDEVRLTANQVQAL